MDAGRFPNYRRLLFTIRYTLSECRTVFQARGFKGCCNARWNGVLNSAGSIYARPGDGVLEINIVNAWLSARPISDQHRRCCPCSNVIHIKCSNFKWWCRHGGVARPNHYSVYTFIGLRPWSHLAQYGTISKFPMKTSKRANLSKQENYGNAMVISLHALPLPRV